MQYLEADQGPVLWFKSFFFFFHRQKKIFIVSAHDYSSSSYIVQVHISCIQVRLSTKTKIRISESP